MNTMDRYIDYITYIIETVGTAKLDTALTDIGITTNEYLNIGTVRPHRLEEIVSNMQIYIKEGLNNEM